MTVTHLTKPFTPQRRHPDSSRFWRASPERSLMYLTGCTNPLTREAALRYPQLGFLAQPGNALHRQAPHYHRWAIDNGVYGVAFAAYHGTRDPWGPDDTEKYLEYLAKVAREVGTDRCLFASAPDVLRFIDNPNPILAAQKKKPIPIGDAEATWEVSRRVFPEIRRLGFPAALVAQDGITREHPSTAEKWAQFDALFLGGSDEMKLGWEGESITETAWMYGKYVHMGRVSSMKRMQTARRFGCDSADGTFIGFGPRKNVPQVLAWLDATNPSRQKVAA